MASTKQIEEYLQKIRRTPSNKLCANCRAPSRLGFSAVCVKYGSFVCDLCKSAHQSFSHRTKSVTMSTWTIEEVRALDEKNGGGNDWCRARWFAKISESELERYAPKEGEPLDNYKKFVHMTYELGKWFDENGKPSGAGAVAKPAAPEPAKATVAPASAKKPAPQMKAAPIAKSQPDEDLLILDFDAAVTISPASASPAPTAASVIKSAIATTTAAADEWGSFTASSPQQSASRPAPAISDDWTFQAAPPLGASASTSPPKPAASLLNNLSSLYQPQAPAAGFNMFAAPAPQTVSMGNGFSAAASTMMMKPAMPANAVAPINAPASSDPFSHLHSFGSAPSVMVNRSSSASNANAAPTMLGTPSLNRAASAPAANDPFAGLI